jgi:adenosylhomocysteinase
MSGGDYRVADISLADFGRKEIELAEHEVLIAKIHCTDC